MKNNVRLKLQSDLSDWILMIISWIIYLGGLIYFARYDNTWVLMALGALPVIISAWFLGMSAGAFSALIAVPGRLCNNL